MYFFLAVLGLCCCAGFLWLWCTGFPSLWLLLLPSADSGARASVVGARWLRICSSQALEHKLNNFGAWV